MQSEPERPSLATAFASQPPNAGPGVIPYITAGFPKLDDTVRILREFELAGCLAAEIGIPHSDPLADGPTIQKTGRLAIDNGMTLGLGLEQASSARAQGVSIPLIVMTCFNLIHAYGLGRFALDALQSGVDGVIVPDLPLEESLGLRAICQSLGLAFVPMVAPTTPDSRIRETCEQATGFVYCVSVTGTTGARQNVGPEAYDLLTRVRNCTSMPRALGFGISGRAHLDSLKGACEAVIVASALMDSLWERGHADAASTVARFLDEMLRDPT